MLCKCKYMCLLTCQRTTSDVPSQSDWIASHGRDLLTTDPRSMTMTLISGRQFAMRAQTDMLESPHSRGVALPLESGVWGSCTSRIAVEASKGARCQLTTSRAPIAGDFVESASSQSHRADGGRRHCNENTRSACGGRGSMCRCGAIAMTMLNGGDTVRTRGSRTKYTRMIME